MGESYTPQCPPNSVQYTIKSGDTLYAIATRYNITLAALTAANPSVNPNALMIGQTLCIPATPSTVRCPANSYQYRVVAGDTMYSIAQRYGVDLNLLLRTNSSVNPNNLVAGQIICIPADAMPQGMLNIKKVLLFRNTFLTF